MTREAARSLFLRTEDKPPGELTAVYADSLAALVERARAGDAESFEQIMVCTERKVAATAWRFLGTREEARDATQEVYLRAYKYLRSFKAEYDFHGWLHRITTNVCRDMLRARRALQVETSLTDTLADERGEIDLPASGGADAAEGAALLSQQREIVRRALDALPEKERTAIVLRDLEGLPTEEVARLMKTRPATVRSQISTARAKLKVFCERILSERRSGGRDL